jgi:hypothetical protein
VTSVYRMAGAKLAIEAAHKLGVVLLANGTGVHAYPHGRMQKHPGLLNMVKRYRDEIMQLLDGIVE